MFNALWFTKIQLKVIKMFNILCFIEIKQKII